MQIPVDHLVYAAPDLERGMQHIEQLTGIAPTFGGQHPGRGTCNALIALGDEVYLEIIAPDPKQPAPIANRWLGVDTVTEPRLTSWAAKGRGLPALRAHAVEHRVPLGEVKAASRRRSDGVLLSWELTEPEPLIAGGVIPFFIDWSASPHPARSAPHGVSLEHFHIEYPDVAEVERMLRVLGIDVLVERAEEPALVAVLEGRHGRVELR